MSTGKLMQIFFVSTPNQAELIKLELQNIGIHCEIDGSYQAGFSSVFEIGILVRESDADAARRFLRKHEQGTESQSP